VDNPHKSQKPVGVEPGEVLKGIKIKSIPAIE